MKPQCPKLNPKSSISDSYCKKLMQSIVGPIEGGHSGSGRESSTPDARRPTPDGDASIMLEVSNLSVAFKTGPDFVPVTHHIDFNLEAGATLGIVGESGSGKSVTSMAVMGLLPRRSSRVTADRLAFGGRDMLKLSPRDWAGVCAARISPWCSRIR